MLYAIISINRYPGKHKSLPGTIYDLYSIILFCKILKIPDSNIHIILDHKDLPSPNNPKINGVDIVKYITQNMQIHYITTAKDFCQTISSILSMSICNLTNLLFYFSGHALKYNDVHPFGKQKEGFIVLPGNSKDKKDYDILNAKYIQNMFLKLGDKIKALCIFDCCFAETILCLSYYQTSSKVLKEYDSVNKDKYKAKIIAWMSSLSNQPSIASNTGSFFTKSIIRYLSSVNDPFDYKTNVQFLEIKKPNYMIRYDQLPVLSISKTVLNQ